MTILALDKKAEVSIDPETYYVLHKIGQQNNCTPEEFIEYLIHNHPDAHDIQTHDKVVFICSCGFKTRYQEEASDHSERFRDHTCTKCIEF